jgi:CRP-like cAMP-binding protein
MRKRTVEANEVIFKQGDPGGCLYIIGKGTFTISINGKSVKMVKRGVVFGELALLYNMNRTATVTCSHDTKDGVLW